MCSGLCPYYRLTVIAPVRTFITQPHELFIIITIFTINLIFHILCGRNIIHFICDKLWLVHCFLMCFSTSHIIILQIVAGTTIGCIIGTISRHIYFGILQKLITTDIVIRCTAQTYVMLQIAHIHHNIIVNQLTHKSTICSSCSCCVEERISNTVGIAAVAGIIQLIILAGLRIIIHINRAICFLSQKQRQILAANACFIP